MKPSEYLDLINAIEAEIPVDGWTVRGIRVWPLVRLRLAWHLHHLAFPELAAAEGVTLRRAARTVAHSLGAIPRAAWDDLRHGARLDGPVDAVFLNQAKVRTLVRGRWYDRLCDPIVEQLAARGRRSLSLELAHGDAYRLPRHGRSVFVQYRLYPRYVVGAARHAWREARDSWRGHRDEQLSGWDDYLEALRPYARSHGLPLPRRAVLRAELEDLLAMADWFEARLRRLRPALGLVICWYSLRSQAFLLACRRLGVLPVDVQHGVQGAAHRAYARWQRVPPAGYELLPEVYWCWSKEEAATIADWSTGTPHRPLVGGNPFVEVWKRGEADFVAHYDERIRALKERHPARRHVLVTLQTEALHDMRDLQEAIRLSPPDWFWWIRLHQDMVPEQERIRAFLREIGANARLTEMDEATRLPLFAWMRHVDVHATMYSTCVLEGLAFGVPSVVTHPYGEEFFPAQVRAGWARPAYEPPAVIEALEAQAGRRASLVATQAAADATPDDAVDRLLAWAERPRRHGADENG